MLNIKHQNYEKERFLGSGDSHSDSCTDGGADRTGNNLMYGIWTILTDYSDVLRDDVLCTILKSIQLLCLRLDALLLFAIIL